MNKAFLIGFGAALIAVSSGRAMAQTDQTLTETINNHGISRNAPALGLSSIYGLNPCSSGLSVGVSTPLFGIGGAAATIDKDCEVRNNAAIAVTALHDERLGREILCDIRDVREAALRLRQPCIQDGGSVPVASTAVQPNVAASRSTITAAPPQNTGEPAQSAVPPAYAPAMPMRIPQRSPGSPAASGGPVPAFCRTPDLDLRLYPECVPGSAAAKEVMERQFEASHEKRASEPPARHPVASAAIRRKAGPNARTPALSDALRDAAARKPAARPAGPMLAATEGCTVPSTLLRLYPECNPVGNVGERPVETAPTSDVSRDAAARKPVARPAGPMLAATEGCTVPSTLLRLYPECNPGGNIEERPVEAAPTIKIAQSH